MIPIEPLVEQDVPSGWTQVTYAADQPEYQPLRALRSATREGQVISRWRLTWHERFAILFGRDIWLTLLTFQQPLQPILIHVGRPSYVQDLILAMTANRSRHADAMKATRSSSGPPEPSSHQKHWPAG